LEEKWDDSRSNPCPFFCRHEPLLLMQ
jgi:hypothetical protein